ncbi:MAG: extracellular solute-binding protein, partial [Clostridia bacterium]|nr:extracellular solute-binding protein [Clostridia bacterium]
MKKILSLVLALVLVLSMAAFTTASAEADIVKLTWAQGTGSTAPLDNAMVLEELNKISVAELGVEVDIQYFTDDQLQISIQSGEVFDMYYTCDWYNNFARCVSQGLFADITDKVKEWTPDLYATMPEYVWDLAKTSDGILYAIPVKKDFAPINMLTYDAEFYASIGMELPDRVEKLSELTPYLKAWKEAHPDRYPITIGGSPAGLDTTFDFIDRTVNIGVSRAVDGTQDEKPVVISEFEDPVILDRWATMHEWYEAGYVNPDAPTLTEDAIESKGK